MCFDVPKVVRNPGCDHGHDEESRNGRDIKIDILDDYIRTPNELRGSPGIYQSAGRVIGSPEGTNGPTWALCVREERAQGLAAHPP